MDLSSQSGQLETLKHLGQDRNFIKERLLSPEENTSSDVVVNLPSDYAIPSGLSPASVPSEKAATDDDTGLLEFHIASLQGHIPRMVQLILDGINIDCRTVYEGHTALHLVACNGNLELARFLLALGADVAKSDYSGKTPLHIAAQYDRAAMVAILVEEGAPLEAVDDMGYTPLLIGVLEDSLDSVKVLVGQGALLSATESEGRNALHIAAWQGHEAVVDYLLRQDVDTSVVCKEGLRAIDVARGRRHDNISATINGQETRLKGCWYPLFGRTRNRNYVILYWILFILINVLFGLLVIPLFGKAFWSVLGVYSSWTLLSTLLYIACSLSDPGYVHLMRPEDIPTASMLQAIIAPLPARDRVCATCTVRKPLRSKHCSVCRRCVARFDHHCPWINNCVGKKNHLKFYVYCCVLLLQCLAVCGLSCFAFFKYADLRDNNTPAPDPFGVLIDLWADAARWITLVLAIVTTIITVGVFSLVLVQTIRIGNNITTYEAHNSWRYFYLNRGGLTSLALKTLRYISSSGAAASAGTMTGGASDLRSAVAIKSNPARYFNNVFDNGCGKNYVKFCCS